MDGSWTRFCGLRLILAVCIELSLSTHFFSCLRIKFSACQFDCCPILQSSLILKEITVIFKISTFTRKQSPHELVAQILQNTSSVAKNTGYPFVHPVNNTSTTLRAQLKQIKTDFLYKINHFYNSLYTWELPSCLRGFWRGAIKKLETEAHNWSQFTIIADVFRDNILLHPASKSHNLPTANAAFIPRPEHKKRDYEWLTKVKGNPKDPFSTAATSRIGNTISLSQIQCPSRGSNLNLPCWSQLHTNPADVMKKIWEEAWPSCRPS